MAPFRWPLLQYDTMLCREVLGRRPSSPSHWDNIAVALSQVFSTTDKPVELKGRGCKERLNLLIEKYNQSDKKTLKKSGTEEEYTELQQLLEDVSTYIRDIQELKYMKARGREIAKEKEKEKVEKGLEMREAALIGMAKRKHGCDNPALNTSYSDDEENYDRVRDDDDTESSCLSKSILQGSQKKKRVTKSSVLQMMQAKFERKASLKEQELQQRKLEFELEKAKFEMEAGEREKRLNMEMEERRAFLNLLKDKL